MNTAPGDMAASSRVDLTPTTAVSTMERMGPHIQMAMVGRVNLTSCAKMWAVEVTSSSSTEASGGVVGEAVLVARVRGRHRERVGGRSRRDDAPATNTDARGRTKRRGAGRGERDRRARRDRAGNLGAPIRRGASPGMGSGANAPARVAPRPSIAMVDISARAIREAGSRARGVDWRVARRSSWKPTRCGGATATGDPPRARALSNSSNLESGALDYGCARDTWHRSGSPRVVGESIVNIS